MSRSSAWHHLRQSVLDHADGTTCPWCSLPVSTTATGPRTPVVEYQPPPAPEGVLVPFSMKYLRGVEKQKNFTFMRPKLPKS